MTIELWQLFLAALAYLLLLFLIAYATERGWLPRRLISHPLVYVLSLGVYATSWSFYGSVGFAASHGYNFLTIYLGVTLAFVLTPLLLQPILRITREHQLASLADLFAFRYQSQLAGVLVTLFMLAGLLPYIALQIRAVTESLQVLTNKSTPASLALAFCATITLFAILFGARHSSAREKHEGLVVAIAFESIIKLAALLAVGLFALFGIFDGPSAMQHWLEQHPEALDALYRPVREGSWNSLLLVAFAAAFLLPRQFHMTFTENPSPRALGKASWTFPLFLLLLNLAIPPILWAGSLTTPDSPPDFYVLAITMQSGAWWLPVLTFIGGVSAASAMMIVTTLALAAMCMNHLVLPASFPPRLSPEANIYSWLLWGRRLLIALIILGGFAFYLLLEHNQGLAQLGIISFVAVAQFLPGIAGLLYWRRATRSGFIAGLLAGALIWTVMLLLPLLENSGLITTGLALLRPAASKEPWANATFISLSVNALLFAAVSLLTKPSAQEREAAMACCRDTLSPPSTLPLADSVQQMEEQLARVTGAEMARHEIGRALADLGLTHSILRPTELSRLRQRLERNLSGLVGPLLARIIVDDRLRLDKGTQVAMADTMRFVEQRLEESRSRLRGLAAELDGLRRYHRQVLHDLPLGVCSIGPGNEIISWNSAMERLSGIEKSDVLGQPLRRLPEPWNGLLSGFLLTREQQLRKVKTRVGQQMRVLNLHKAAIDDPGRQFADSGAGTVVLVEDLTDLHTLEAELAHSERLASIGRLAAGVAHEVGNPVTAIACLSQNMLSDLGDLPFIETSLHQILEQTQRISNIVHSLVNFSHGGASLDHPAAPLPLSRCVDEALHLITLSHNNKQLEFIRQGEPDLMINGNRQRLVQVFVNLLSNASDASAPGDTITVTTRCDEEQVVVEIDDAGHGIDEAHLDKVFDPFFTTKAPGSGTGLGLPLVFNIVQEHSGTITLGNRSEGGVRVTLCFPRVVHAPAESVEEPQV
ncbi:MAG TPA: ATP-binding protein [Gammaproteobacteria bacterium]